MRSVSLRRRESLRTDRATRRLTTPRPVGRAGESPSVFSSRHSRSHRSPRAPCEVRLSRADGEGPGRVLGAVPGRSRSRRRSAGIREAPSGRARAFRVHDQAGLTVRKGAASTERGAVSATRTAVEISPGGTPLRLFHRQGGSAWTHPLDDPAFLTTGRHGALVTRPCPVCARGVGGTNGRASELPRGTGAVPGGRASP
jgi:hypothetical protein